jgi:hypothetical protein
MSLITKAHETAFGLKRPDVTFRSITKAFDICLKIADPDALRAEAGRLRDFLDGYKRDEATIVEAFMKSSQQDLRAGGCSSRGKSTSKGYSRGFIYAHRG